MSVVPKLRSERSGAADSGLDRPRLRLHRCRLDYDAALRERLRGGCAARVARAAGSRATSRRNLRRVGLKIVARLPSRNDVLAIFNRLGYTIEDFCRGVIAQTEATRTTRYHYRGRLIAEYSDPDPRAQTAARWMYIRSVGVLELPLTAPVPTFFEKLYWSRPPEDWDLIAQLSAKELHTLVKSVREHVQRGSGARPA